jgi:hypothetical protein
MRQAKIFQCCVNGGTLTRVAGGVNRAGACAARISHIAPARRYEGVRPSPRQVRLLGWCARLALCGALAGGCAGTHPTAAGAAGGSGASGASGAGLSFGTGTGTGTGAGGASPTGAAGATGTAGASAACMEGQFKFVPKTPTVFLLVDQSGSMFECRTAGGAKSATANECANRADTSWYPLRDGVLQVVQQLGSMVRFGFSAFTGEMGDAMCPKLDPVAPALDNAAAISARYKALVPPRKGETPTRNALAQVGKILADDQGAPGEKFILFVTDGQPDYCDDGNPLCPPDSVVGELQTLEKANVHTLVFGISSPLTTISDAVLAAFANAGAGQPVARLADDVNAIYDQCAGVPGWQADFAMTGKAAMRPNTIGAYAPAGGAAPVFKPDLTNQTALVGAISNALSGVKSCVFDLGNLGGGKPISVDTTQLDKAHVLIMGAEIPLDDTNGWHMTSDTQLELSGTACDTWRKPDNTTIDFQFPCQIIIVM